MGDLMDIVIREASKKDAELLRSIEARDGFKYPYNKTVEDYLKYFDEGNKFYIAELAGAPAGYIAMIDSNNFIRSTNRLHFLAVVKDYQGQKIGTKLVQHVEAKAKEEDKNRIIVFVYENNSDAVRFYVKQGFKSWFIVPNVYEKGISAHVFYKDVGPMYINRMKEHIESLKLNDDKTT